MWRLYAEYGRGNVRYAVLGAILSAFARVSGLVPALLLGIAIDAILLGSRPFGLPLVPGEWIPASAAGQLWLVVAILVGATVAGSLATYLSNYGWNRFAQNIQHTLRVDAYERMQLLDRAFFDRTRTGEVLSVLNNDVNQLESFLTDGVNNALRIGVLVAGIGVVMFLLNPWLALVSLLAVPVLVVFTAVFVRRVQPKYARTRASVGALNATLENNVSGIEVIKTEHAEEYEAERVRGSSLSYYDANWDAIKTRITFFPALTSISGLGFALTFAVGAFWVLQGPPPFAAGRLTPGQFVTFMLYTQQFIWPIAQFGQIVDSYQKARASSDRVYGLLNESPTVGEPDEPYRPDSLEGEVHYDDVTFSYPRVDDELEDDVERDENDGDERADIGVDDAGSGAFDGVARSLPALDGVSMSIEAGQTVGIVGPTGSGKSTLVRLLVRLYDPDEGTVRVDGHDVREFSLEHLRRGVGYVSQEPFLFYGTIAENVAYGTYDDSTTEDARAAIERATRQASAHEFVRNLPEGYDTLVGERGVRLSGGQRQRIALARTILKDPDVLVLDEATSHVDTETEALIQRSLAELTADRTTIAIAHRLSTVRDADVIYVLDRGRVVEAGSHEELLAADGLYTNLWRVQAGDIGSLPEAFFEDAIARRGTVETD
jgi:ATP-binding cassette subfamily B protein